MRSSLNPQADHLLCSLRGMSDVENLVLAYILAGLVCALSIISHERVIHNRIESKVEIAILLE